MVEVLKAARLKTRKGTPRRCSSIFFSKSSLFNITLQQLEELQLDTSRDSSDPLCELLYASIPHNGNLFLIHLSLYCDWKIKYTAFVISLHTIWLASEPHILNNSIFYQWKEGYRGGAAVTVSFHQIILLHYGAPACALSSLTSFHCWSSWCMWCYLVKVPIIRHAYHICCNQKSYFLWLSILKMGSYVRNIS